MYDRLSGVLDALDRTERHLDYVEDAVVRVREAADYAASTEPDWHTVTVRESAASSSPSSRLAQGKALGDALFSRRADGTLVRESTHPLGKVISGAHSHGSVRHTHDRLPGDHLHCMHCGGDSRLCLDNPHHAEGPTPVRESAGRAQGRACGDSLFDYDPAHPPRALNYREHMALGGELARLERAAAHRPSTKGSAGAGDRGLLEAWERIIGGSRP